MINEDEFKDGIIFFLKNLSSCNTNNFIDLAQVNNDDSKFSRHLKKLLKLDDDEKVLQKVDELKNYLYQSENIKVFK